MNKAPVKLPLKHRPVTNDESESDEDESGSDDDTPIKRDLAKPSTRSDSVRSHHTTATEA
jgi:hypothetical protein